MTEYKKLILKQNNLMNFLSKKMNGEQNAIVYMISPSTDFFCLSPMEFFNLCKNKIAAINIIKENVKSQVFGEIMGS